MGKKSSSGKLSRALAGHGRAIQSLILVSIFFCTPIGAQTPKPMQKNVFALTEAAAVLNVCFESPEYKGLETESALKIHELTMRITVLVERISKHYDDESLYLTFEMMRVKISSDPEMKEYVKNEYQYCGDNLVNEMENYVGENEKIINEYLSLKQQ